MNGHTVRNIKRHLNKGIKIRNEQIKAHNQKILENARDDIGKKDCPQCLPLIPAVSNDDLLMMNPFFSERTVYHMEHIRQWFNRVLEKCDFERRYTLYSLRSTYISFALLDGQRVNLVAKNCGTSLAMIQKTYDGLSSRFDVDSLGFFKDVQSKDKADMLLSNN